MSEIKSRRTKKSFNITIRVSRKIRELNELISEVESLTSDLNGNDTGNDDKMKKEFDKIKEGIFTSLFVVKQKIETRHLTKANSGNTAAVIRSQLEIKKMIDQLDRDFNALTTAYGRQTRLRSIITPEEMDSMFGDLQICKTQIAECRFLLDNDGLSAKEITEKCNFVDVMKESNIKPPAYMQGEWRQPTPEETAVMSKWAQQDALIDKGVYEVGEVVDTLKDIALGISEKAKLQDDMAMELCTMADRANDDLVELNSKVKNLLSKNKGGSHVCLRIVLIVLLFGLISWLVKVVSNRL